MNVTVKLFASARQYLPENSDGGSCEIKLQKSAAVQDLVTHLGIPAALPKMVLVNGLHSHYSQKLTEGDVVSIIPPIAGG